MNPLIILALTLLVSGSSAWWGYHEGVSIDKARSDLVISNLQRDAAKAAGQLRDKALAAQAEYAADKQQLLDKLTEAYRAQSVEQAKNRRIELELSRAHADVGGLRDAIAAFARAGSSGDEIRDNIAACRKRAEALGNLLDDSVRVQEEIAGGAESTLAEYRLLFDGWPVSASTK
jgi:hypothetical protein